MPFKIRGVELVRRIRIRVPEYQDIAEHCLQHAEDIKKKISDLADLAGIAGHGKMQIMPDPDQIWKVRAESYKDRANDLQWLSDAIVENEIHEVTGEELVNLGIMGTTSIEVFSSESPSED